MIERHKDLSLRPRDRRRAPACSPAESGLFAVNPIRRSLGALVLSVALLVAPLLLPAGDTQTAVLLVTIWFGSGGIFISLPILVFSLLEGAWDRCQRRLWPTIDDLELSPRARHLLRRHGFVTIPSVEQTHDSTLLLLANMDGRILREIRRSINLWRYRRWQEGGFR